MTDHQLINMPKGAVVRHIDVQHGIPCLWAEADPSQPMEGRGFVIVGTGHEIPYKDHLAFRGTFMLNDGNFVGHVYEEGV